MKSSKLRMETDQCKLGSIQKYLEEYHYPHRNDHVINTATVKPQKNWIILWSSLNLRYSLKISPMYNLKWNLFFKGFCKSDKKGCHLISLCFYVLIPWQFFHVSQIVNLLFSLKAHWIPSPTLQKTT